MAVDTVSAYLHIWLRHFDRGIPKSRWQRLWVSCHGTGVKWSILVGLAVQTLSTLDCFMARTSVLDAGPSIRFIFGIYSCIWGVYLHAFKRDAMLRTIRRLLAVAEAVEGVLGDGDADVKELLRVAARGSSRYLRSMEAWSVLVFVSVIPPAVLTGRPANPTWPEPTTPLGRYALLGLHVLSTVFLPIGFFTSIAMIYGLQNCGGAMLRAVGRRLERAATEEEVHDMVALSSALNEGLTMMNKVFRLAYVNLLQSTLMLPLMATYEVMNGHFDPFLYCTGPLNIVIFIPLCFTGQGVESAGREVGDHVYAGRWEEESVRCRSLRLQVLTRATYPLQCTSRELGPVNLALCQSSLRSWFSYLNFMLTTQGSGTLAEP